MVGVSKLQLNQKFVGVLAEGRELQWHAHARGGETKRERERERERENRIFCHYGYWQPIERLISICFAGLIQSGVVTTDTYSKDKLCLWD